MECKFESSKSDEESKLITNTVREDYELQFMEFQNEFNELKLEAISPREEERKSSEFGDNDIQSEVFKSLNTEPKELRFGDVIQLNASRRTRAGNKTIYIENQFISQPSLKKEENGGNI